MERGINTGEKRLVLSSYDRGQLGNKVEADGVDKRDFLCRAAGEDRRLLPIKFMQVRSQT